MKYDIVKVYKEGDFAGMYPVVFSLGPVSLYTFGIFALLAFFFTAFIVWKRALEAHFSEEEVVDTTILVTLSGIIFARALFVALNFKNFGFWIFSWFSLVRQPGLIFWGGLVGGGLALFLIAKRKDWEFFTISDIAVTGLSLAQAIGWIGAFFSGFGLGREVEKFGLIFPGYTAARLPLQLVRALLFLALFIYLWNVEGKYRTFEWYRNKKASSETGFLTFSYLFFLGLIKVIVALFADSRVYFFWIPLDIIFGILISSFGLVGLYWRSGREINEDLLGFRSKFTKLIKKQEKIKSYEKGSVSSQSTEAD